MRLPPINAIRVFEAAARLGGFTRAGEELGMTQAAVSYQIKQLEERLGFPLFVREGRRVSLTRQGEALSERTSEAFRMLERAFDAARRGGDDILTISALPTFCENWLVPRLSAFQKAHPRLGVRIDAERRLVDVRGGEADIAVRVGSGDWPGLETRFLFPGSVAPLVPAAAVAAHGPFERPEDLLKLRLIGPIEWWRGWFAAVGAGDAPLPERPALELETQTMEVAAAMGAGDAAVMVTPFYFASEIAAGALVKPFETELDEGAGHWLVYDPDRARTPKIRAFVEWVLFDPQAFCLNRATAAPPPAGDAG
ncbi:LysR family transcriptional regulator [Marinicauda salina]|uniref:LysR family transcriptional regulator n=1 Tax=Marinicauda salina TaxID=2135793 RepID=A0A2U2BW03_9PROT|nr:LysR substrate-binding domain-containing protein [Marinicauda salina]PWE18188.1 LysR family transcriptional regulator [Marinicauda salina]